MLQPEPTWGVSTAEYNRIQAAKMTERTFQAAVVGFAQRVGWLVYHTYDSRRSQPGYPDLHLVNPTQGRSIFRELKTQKGKLTPAQQKWIAALKDAGVDVDVWRPVDWWNDTITNQLVHAPRTVEEKQTALLEATEAERILGIPIAPWQRAVADAALNHEGTISVHVPSRATTADRARFERFLLEHENEPSNPKE